MSPWHDFTLSQDGKPVLSIVPILTETGVDAVKSTLKTLGTFLIKRNIITHYICREWVDEVFIYAEMAELERIQDEGTDGEGRTASEKENEAASGTVAALVEQCRLMAIPIHIRVPLGGHNGRSFVENVSGFDVVTLTVNYASPLQLFLKRMMDILGGAVGSVLALLTVIVFGPVIRIKSPGPVLFKQDRGDPAAALSPASPILGEASAERKRG